jgi:23S rRNA pseudouridine955/2504/2580 synthase
MASASKTRLAPRTARAEAPRSTPVEAAFDSVANVTIDEANEGQRLDNFLLGRLKGVPKSHVYRIIRSGEVRVNKGRIDQTYRLEPGDVVRIPPLRTAKNEANSSTGAASQAKMAGKARQSLSFIFEDEALLAIEKPAGMAVHGGSGVSFGVIEALRAARPDAKFLELVHRLDRETSGILLVAKKRSALTAMHAMLRGDDGRKIEKHYFALVKGDWPDQRRSVRIKLAKYHTASGERRVSVDEEDGQDAHTIFTRVEQVPTATLLDCDIRTGRTHQIRVHLAHLGFPIIGDDKYGDFALNKVAQAVKNGGLKRMFLHARRIRFPHPLTGENLTIESPLPPDLQRYLDHLRKT